MTTSFFRVAPVREPFRDRCSCRPPRSPAFLRPTPCAPDGSARRGPRAALDEDDAAGDLERRTPNYRFGGGGPESTVNRWPRGSAPSPPGPTRAELAPGSRPTAPRASGSRRQEYAGCRRSSSAQRSVAAAASTKDLECRVRVEMPMLQKQPVEPAEAGAATEQLTLSALPAIDQDPMSTNFHEKAEDDRAPPTAPAEVPRKVRPNMAGVMISSDGMAVAKPCWRTISRTNMPPLFFC